MSKRRPAKQDTVLACGVCGRDAIGAFVCRDCMDGYHGTLAGVPDLARELRIERSRLAVKGGSNEGRRSAQTALAYVVAAANALDALRAALVTSCRVLALDQPLPADRISAMCAWLATREASIPLRPEGPDIVAELHKAVKRGMRVIDNPPDKVLRGKCHCLTELYAERAAQTVTCPGCGFTHRGDDVDAHTEKALRDSLADWEQLRQYGLRYLGIPRSTLDGWHTDGKLAPATVGGSRYRVADLMDLDVRRRARGEPA